MRNINQQLVHAGIIVRVWSVDAWYLMVGGHLLPAASTDAMQHHCGRDKHIGKANEFVTEAILH
jgi:hypothetical protein